MTKINVVDGDITDVKAQALITAINPIGLWTGAVDGVIMKAAGNMFHDQAEHARPLYDGDVVLARKGSEGHRGSFEDVLFVVDDQKVKAYSVVTQALRGAAARRIKTVSIPLIRTGSVAGRFEPREAALEHFALAIIDFVEDEPEPIDEITVVVYHNNADHDYLLRKFRLV